MIKTLKNNKKLFCIVTFSVLILFAVLLIFIIFNNSSSVKKEIPISYSDCTYNIDVNDMREVVGDSDYVFIGKVEKNTGTVYKNPVETEKGTISSPYTNYSVSVLKNIKGSLVQDTPIIIQKEGGLSEDGKQYLIVEGDFLLEEGETYVFFAYTQSDGSLLVAGANSNVLVKNVDSKTDLTKTEEYKKVSNAFNNQKLTKRNHQMAKNDISYNQQ